MKNLCILLLLCASAALPLHAQLRAAPAPTPAAVPAQNLTQDIAARSRELNSLFNDIWQDKLRHEPEYATTLGDKRYDDQLTDFSPRAYNESLARGRAFIERLAAIDTTGLPHQAQLSAELMLRSLIEDQEAARFKEWEMPVNQYEGLQLDLPQLAAHTSFDNADDYDHYIARLAKVPAAFSQIMTNLQSGLDDHRTPPQFLMQKALAETQSIAAQKPADSPFALPLKNFPASVGPGRPEAHHGSRPRRHRQPGSPLLPALRQVPRRRLHPQLPHRSRHLGPARRRRLLRLPHPPVHHAE